MLNEIKLVSFRAREQGTRQNAVNTHKRASDDESPSVTYGWRSRRAGDEEEDENIDDDTGDVAQRAESPYSAAAFAGVDEEGPVRI